MAHSAGNGFHELWSLPIFFPVRGALALSDHMLGAGMLAALLPASWPRGLVVYNLLLLLSFPASAFITAYVLRRSGLPPFAAWLGGIVFAFSPFRWDGLSHVQVLLTQWIPLLLWLWDRLLAERRARTAVAFVLVYALHMLGGSYLAYMVHVPLLVIALVRLRAHGRELLRPAALRVLLPAVLVAGAVAVAVYAPYVVIGERLGIERSRSECIRWGATLASYLQPSRLNLYAGPWRDRFAREENTLFAGFVPSALAALGLLALLASRPAPGRPPWQRIVLGLLLLAGAAALLAGDAQTWRGPGGAHYATAQWTLLAALVALLVLRRRWRPEGGSWWQALSPWQRGLLLSTALCALLTTPLLYLALRGVVPGLSGMRVPARFYGIVSFGIAYLAASGTATLLARYPGRRGIALATALALLLAVDVLPRAIDWQPLPRLPADLPPTHQWLLQHRAEVGAYLELPLDNVTNEIAGMYFQSAHWLPAVNGYSGWFPPLYQHLVTCCSSPWMGAEQVAELRAAGVTHLLLAAWKSQPGEYGPWVRLERRLLRQEAVRVRARVGGNVVLEILPATAAAPPPASAGRATPAPPPAPGAAPGSGSR